MLNQILNYFEHLKWKHIVSENRNAIIWGIRGINGEFKCIVDISPEEKGFLCFSIFPLNTPQHLRKDIVEFLMRVNYILFFGTFELDFSDGEIRFKTALIYQDESIEISYDLLDRVIKRNIMIMDVYFPIIDDLVKEKLAVSNALDKIKQKFSILNK